MNLKTAYLFLGLLFLALAIPGRAQKSTFNWDALSENSNRLEGKLTGSLYYISPLANSTHFLHNKWENGSILFEDGDCFENQRIRYHSFRDELVAYNPNLKQLFIVDKEKVSSFTFQNDQNEQQFVKLWLDAFVGAGNRYFELKYEGVRWLLAFHSVLEEKTSIYRDRYGKLRDTRLKPKVTYYMYFPQEKRFQRIQDKRRSFIKLFPDNKREVRRLFRKNNLWRFNEKEMVRAFQLLDEAGFFD
jgi:hypothetical protein